MGPEGLIISYSGTEKALERPGITEVGACAWQPGPWGSKSLCEWGDWWEEEGVNSCKSFLRSGIEVQHWGFWSLGTRLQLLEGNSSKSYRSLKMKPVAPEIMRRTPAFSAQGRDLWSSLLC